MMLKLTPLLESNKQDDGLYTHCTNITLYNSIKEHGFNLDRSWHGALGIGIYFGLPGYDNPFGDVCLRLPLDSFHWCRLDNGLDDFFDIVKKDPALKQAVKKWSKMPTTIDALQKLEKDWMQFDDRPIDRLKIYHSLLNKKVSEIMLLAGYDGTEFPDGQMACVYNIEKLNKILRENY